MTSHLATRSTKHLNDHMMFSFMMFLVESMRKKWAKKNERIMEGN